MVSLKVLLSEESRVLSRLEAEESWPVSRWSKSFVKRWFDVTCAVFSLPLVLPVLLVTGLAVRLTSRGPVMFRQQRIGRDGRPFTILKFRTMPVEKRADDRPCVTTSINQRFTPVGPFLRRWKLDELPQVFNVLRGEMSLVGPRPKLAIHQTTRLACRPGITGRATLVFACEESVLAHVPHSELETFYQDVVLPLKQQLDDEYMAEATLFSDLDLIVRSVVRRWDRTELIRLLDSRPLCDLSEERVSLRHFELTPVDS
jgi:lipopolysaccharide/colanic/teichoic acid biosynthesis glycosyltransferase